jgi:Mg-chelatase subunit ChlI
MDFLFRSRVEELHRVRQQQQHRHDESSSSGSSSSSSRSKQQSSKSKQSAAAAAAAAAAATQGWHDDDLAHRYALETMDSYARGLRVSIIYYSLIARGTVLTGFECRLALLMRCLQSLCGVL